MKTSLTNIMAACIFLAGNSCTHSSAREHGHVTHLQPIALHPGVNKIEMLVPDGRAGMIVTATETSGTTLYLVMLPDNAGTGWNTVTTGTDEASLKADGTATAILFAKAWLDGSPETLLFTASRVPGTAAQGPAPYDILTYKLVTGRGGATPSGFEQVAERQSDTSYSTAQAALQGEIH